MGGHDASGRHGGDEAGPGRWREWLEWATRIAIGAIVVVGVWKGLETYHENGPADPTKLELALGEVHLGEGGIRATVWLVDRERDTRKAIGALGRPGGEEAWYGDAALLDAVGGSGPVRAASKEGAFEAARVRLDRESLAKTLAMEWPLRVLGGIIVTTTWILGGGLALWGLVCTGMAAAERVERGRRLHG